MLPESVHAIRKKTTIKVKCKRIGIPLIFVIWRDITKSILYLAIAFRSYYGNDRIEYYFIYMYIYQLICKIFVICICEPTALFSSSSKSSAYVSANLSCSYRSV